MDQPMDAAHNPQSLMQIYMGMMGSRVLSAAVQLDLFSRLAEGHTTAPAVARALSASERGTRMLLDALSALGLLHKADGRYQLLPASQAYLVRSSPDYAAALMETNDLWDAWGQLTDVVRTGRPVHTLERQERAEAFFPTLIRSLHVLNREPARRLAEALAVEARTEELRVLDIGAGSAVWSIAVAEACPKASVTAQDFAGMLGETRRFVERHGLSKRFDYLAGDLNEVSFGTARFDLAVLGNIVHSEGEGSARNLFRRLHTALRPGGRIAIVDFVPAEDRSGPPPAVLFAITMLVNTEHGDTFTFSEYRTWLGEAGFTAIGILDIGHQIGFAASAIVATRG
ncbi:MAG: methyltransferase [Acetobacteraceae bacterium]